MPPPLGEMFFEDVLKVPKALHLPLNPAFLNAEGYILGDFQSSFPRLGGQFAMFGNIISS